VKPITDETAWLQQSIGNWRYELATLDERGSCAIITTGTERVWPLGDMWVVAENVGEAADGAPTLSLTTIGFEPARQRFTGSVATTMVPVLFTLDGAIDRATNALQLRTKGPALTVTKGTDRYRDVHRIIDSGTRELIAEVRAADGQWRAFMRTQYNRWTGESLQSANDSQGD